MVGLRGEFKLFTENSLPDTVCDAAGSSLGASDGLSADKPPPVGPRMIETATGNPVCRHGLNCGFAVLLVGVNRGRGRPGSLGEKWDEEVGSIPRGEWVGPNVFFV